MDNDQNTQPHSQLFSGQFQNGDPIKIPIPSSQPEISAPQPQPIFEDPLSRPELLRTSGLNKSEQRLYLRIPQILLIGILFILAMIIGAALRLYGNLSFFAKESINDQVVPTETKIPLPTSAHISTDDWITHRVVSGATKQEIAGFTYKLPPGVLSLICDGNSCASQGTFLLGGTRLTVAAHGGGQILPELGKVFTDVSGQQFTIGQMVVGNMIPATGFTGTFVGTTYGGFSFDRIRGALVPHKDLVIELNHFTPKGVIADFEKDDVLFDSILSTIQVETTSSGKNEL